MLHRAEAGERNSVIFASASTRVAGPHVVVDRADDELRSARWRGSAPGAPRSRHDGGQESETHVDTLARDCRENLEEKLRALPRGPGVYLFRDAAGEVLYVGKAKSLRSRVRSYFQRGDTRVGAAR